MRATSYLLFVFGVASLGACGARTSLDTSGAGDGSTPIGDAGLDGSVDASPDGGGGLVVTCPRSPQYTAPRQELMLQATASSEGGFPSTEWDMVRAPDGAAHTLSSLGSGGVSNATLTTGSPGEYLLRFTATDDLGMSASCDVIVQSVVGPPVAICPLDPIRTRVNVPVVIVGDSFDDEGVVSHRWTTQDAPTGATATLTNASQPVVEFRGDRLGFYTLRLTVSDADMAQDSCDAVVQVTGPPVVTCPESPIEAPTRQPLDIRAEAVDDVGIVSLAWEMSVRPTRSDTTLSPTDGLATRMTPDRQGEYLLTFTATDEEGLSSSCRVVVMGTPTPPTVTCPAQIETPPLRAVDIAARGVDDGEIVRWRWQLTEPAEGSSARPPSPADRPITSFMPDIVGIYGLTVTATDNDEMSASCQTQVIAGNIDGLRVEMFWDSDGTDIDLHLLNPIARAWRNDNDCYYGNCNVMSGNNLEWAGPGDDDNPRLDLDNTSGFGPENINITAPEAGIYRIGIHHFSANAPARVTVRVYCGGDTTEPRQTFGPVELMGRVGPSARMDFWRVADVNLSGFDCTIDDLSEADGSPNLAIYNRTLNRR